MLRLTMMRDALLSANGAETVTQIAMRFGVRELGRFSVEYRNTFGESPSETLTRRSESNCCDGAPPRSGPRGRLIE
jgi:AraC-like DNA-binding protein